MTLTIAQRPNRDLSKFGGAESRKRAKPEKTRGLALLDKLFMVDRAALRMSGGDWSRWKSVRTCPNTPPVRDREHQARHRRNKAARMSRRRNWS